MTKAAGILPLSVDNEGNIVVLLGQENVDNKLVWSGFGGGAEKGESPKKTAAREGWEESMGFLGTKEDIYNIINSDNNRNIAAYANDRYTEYVIYVSYNKDWPQLFKRIYDYWHKCGIRDNTKDPALYIPTCPKGYSEKLAIKWVKLVDLRKGEYDGVLRDCFREMFAEGYNIILSGIDRIEYCAKAIR